VSPREKGPRDLVTDADLASQKAIREVLLDAFPEHDFLGEESEEGGGEPGHARPYRWIVDPLDGTANYVHGMRGFSVSIGLEYRGQMLVGVVYDPVSEECFTAGSGAGAWLNGQSIQASSCDRLSRALVAVSFSARVERDSPQIRRFIEVVTECQSLRRMGSAALNLSYMACGRLDGYFATSLKTWDVAAGVLIAREAGVRVSSVDGSPFDLTRPWLAAAATKPLHEQLLRVLARAES
jgi:myo-inositol-1(or 4)-monophosphatase